MNDPERVSRAMAAFDAANTDDPNLETVDGTPQPKELIYARRMTECLAELEPDASVALRLAVRCQHLCRWTIPRDRYPSGRAGYRRWRSDLADFHAEKAGTILRDVGYDDATVARVQALVRKERFKTDPEAQTLEDVACLVFLEHYLDDFSSQHDQPKLVDILRKTWKKMSPRGRSAALELNLSAEVRALIELALADDTSK